jgi:predicted ester cyclase
MSISIPSIVTTAQLEAHYRAYIDTLNRAAWNELPNYLAPSVIHNDKSLDYAGYQALIPSGTTFLIESTTADVHKRDIGVRLDIRIQGDQGVKRVREHVFYRFGDNWKIVRVWSMVEDYIGSPPI